MSEFKGTPGPWFVSDRPHSYGREVSAGSPGGQVIAGGNGAPWPSLAEQQANARLIAAAPLLAEALQRLEGCIGWRDDMGRFVLLDESFAFGYGRDGTGALSDARAALKAAGYSNSTGV